MRPRFRMVGALLALMAFSASFAEGLWASTCMDTVAMGAMDAAGMDAMDPPTGGEALQDQASGPAQPCPLMAIMGGCAMISLPALEPVVEFAATVQAKLTVAVARAPDLLLVSSLLHPPRA